MDCNKLCSYRTIWGTCNVAERHKVTPSDCRYGKRAYKAGIKEDEATAQEEVVR